MLAHSQSSAFSPYTPLNSSPLAARSPNAFAVMSPMSPPPTPRAARDIKTPFSARQAKPNPFLQRQSLSGEQRRREYLQKGRQASENRRLQARGGEDELMRLVWIAERKRWENEQAGLASDVSMVESDDERDTSKPGATIQSSPNDSEMAEDVARDEDEELQALVDMLDNGSTSPSNSLSNNVAGGNFLSEQPSNPALKSTHRGGAPAEQWDEDIPDSEMLGIFENRNESWPVNGIQASIQGMMEL